MKFLTRNKLIFIANDFGVIFFSFYFSLILIFNFNYSFIISNEISIFSVSIFAFVKLLYFNFFSLYKGMYRYTSLWDLVNIIRSNLLSTLTFIILSSFHTNLFGLTTSFFIIDFGICTILISFSRLVVRMYFSHFENFLGFKNIGRKRRDVVLIGAGYSGQNILRQTLQNPSSKLNVVGFLDDDMFKQKREIHGVSVLGTIGLESLKNIKYDEILICIPSANKSQMQKIINFCKNTKMPFKTLPSISELIEGKVSIKNFREVSLLDLLGRDEINLDKDAISNFIKGKRVLITGSGGSIGSELVRQCIKYKPSVLMMIEISELNLFQIDREINDSSDILIKPILSDIRDKNSLNSIFEDFKPQVVFHAAAYKHVPIQESFPWEAIKTNVFGTLNLSELSVSHNVEKFVLVSTDKAVKPTNVMGASKRLAEIVIKNYNLLSNDTEFMAVRFGNVLGSSGSVIPIFQEQIKNGGPITITDPDMERYFMSIPEASQLILQAGSLGIGSEVFILDMGSPIKILDIANELIRLSGYEPELDIPIVITGKRPGEKKIEELALPSENLDKTKHDKIFVLNDNKLTESYIFDLIKNIKELESNLTNRNPDQLKSRLSDILPEYEPSDVKEKVFSRIKSEAEA